MLAAPTCLADSSTDGNRFYLSAQGGLGGLQTPKLSNPDTYDLGDYTWRYSGGYLYQLDKMEYGVEIGYNGYQSSTYGKPVVTEFSGFSYDMLGVVRYDFYKQWHIFAELGAAQFHMTTQSDTTVPETQHLTKILPEVSFGFGYGFGNHWALNISFDYEFGKNPQINENNYQVIKNNVPTNSSILVGLAYTF